MGGERKRGLTGFESNEHGLNKDKWERKSRAAFSGQNETREQEQIGGGKIGKNIQRQY